MLECITIPSILSVSHLFIFYPSIPKKCSHNVLHLFNQYLKLSK